MLFVLHLLGDLDIDLDGFFILYEVTQHLTVVLQTIYTSSKQLVQPVRKECLSLEVILSRNDLYMPSSEQ
jgi:hypothetical protein